MLDNLTGRVVAYLDVWEGMYSVAIRTGREMRANQEGWESVRARVPHPLRVVSSTWLPPRLAFPYGRFGLLEGRHYAFWRVEEQDATGHIDPDGASLTVLS